METHTPSKITFMKRFKRYEPVVQDHSSIICAKKCKRMYFLRIVLGFIPKEHPQYFGFGSCYHRFRETLENLFMAADPTLRKTKEWQLTALEPSIESARALWKLKKMRDPQLGDKWDFLTVGRLLESCLTAFKHWQREKERGSIEVIATEQNFIVPLPDGTLVAGKADQIVKWNGKVWGRDFKTSSKEQNAYFKRTLDPNDQFTRYTWAEGELAGVALEGQIVEVLYNAKSTKKEQKGPEIHTHLATRSSEQIKSWVDQQMFYNKILTLMRDEDMYPMEEASCQFCAYHSVCSKGSENGMMNKLESEFKIEPWDCTNRVDNDDA